MTSVIVPVHNAEAWLPALLDSLAAQDHREPWEVVLVDNLCHDRSMDVAGRYAGRLPLVFESAPKRGNPAYARNTGVARARGDRVLFIDADDAVAPDYVRIMSAALDEHVLVTSRVDSTTLNAPWLQDAHGPAWQSEGIGTFYDFLPACGINIGIGRHEFDRLGGYSERFSSAEDIAFAWTAQMRGIRLHFVRDAVYHYRYRPTLRRLFRQGSNWGSDSVRLYQAFGTVGMPGRSTGAAATEWSASLRGFFGATSRQTRAPFAVRLGLCAGRLRGSLRYRTRYF